MHWERNHTPSSFEDLQLSISHCDVDQVWHFLSQKPARPQIDLVVQQFSISHRAHVWWCFVISKRTLQNKNEQKCIQRKRTHGNTKQHRWFCCELYLALLGCIVLATLCSFYASRTHWTDQSRASSNHQTCWALSRPLRCWKPSFFCTGTVERSPWERRLKPQGIDRPSCQTATERLRSRNSGAWHPIGWTPSGQMDMGQSHRRCWHADSQRRPHVAERETKNTKKHKRRHMSHAAQLWPNSHKPQNVCQESQTQ